jgi:hypothetical protein
MRVRRAKLSERKDDYHRTPIEAVQALLRIEQLPIDIWEPACGDGAIVRPLREAGHLVRATDLVDRGCPVSESRIDFLMERACPRETVRGIVTNPPYKLAQQFCARALALVPYVAMLLPLGFLAGQERHSKRHWLARVHVSSRRLPMMHREGWAGPVATSQVDHAWFVWDQSWEGEPVIRWFDWKEQRGPPG